MSECLCESMNRKMNTKVYLADVRYEYEYWRV